MFMKKEFNFKEGEVLLLDKPLEWTSFDVVNSIRVNIRRNFGIKKLKVGHAGTLDPLATGLLILCTGKMTKQIESIQAQIKEYTGTIRFGATTPSYDLETEVDKEYPIDHLNEEILKDGVKQFLGELEQTPPVFSAIKIEGKRAYEYARKNEEVKIKSKKINIFEFELTRIELPEVDFRVICSKGTYIRSLAHDLGKALDSGAHLTALRRTKIGDFNVEDAVAVDDFRALLVELGENEELS
jgi:tRNA pseudouridine55 synthase